MRNFRQGLGLSITTPRQKRMQYHRSLDRLNDRVMTLRHEFLQCQGALLAALWRDPPSLLKEHLAETLGRLSHKERHLTRLLESTEQRRLAVHRRRWASTRYRRAVEQLEQLYATRGQEARGLLADIGRLMTLTRELAQGGRREQAIAALGEVASHYTPGLSPSRPWWPFQTGPVHRPGFGFVVETIPKSEWERHAAVTAGGAR
ncbi:hypothetical protein [Halomonas maura]|uniref:hypothetical protein n=1 Tax=Halomonas maura TaxID=117606 RepID=UPI0025B559E8|nr:hypothetical protein [Halomonas maura]MDN3557834.1 hypothetical protein [Halomonas maura]